MTDQEPVLFAETDRHVLTLRLNRPHCHHAIDWTLSRAIINAIEEAEQNDEIRVIVIKGAGDRAFCAGQDMLEMNRGEVPPEADGNSSAGIAVERVARARKPVIAAVNGICYGGGALLALACDIRIGTETATFRFPGAEYGLVVGAAWLPRIVGAAVAKEWIYTAKKIEAEEALRHNFLTRVHPVAALDRETAQLAAAIAKNSMNALCESKRVIDAASLDAEAE